jgi:hypothetical protein
MELIKINIEKGAPSSILAPGYGNPSSTCGLLMYFLLANIEPFLFPQTTLAAPFNLLWK